MNAIPKSSGLIALVDRLRRDLGQGYFIEVLHWDSDRARGSSKSGLTVRD
jgi:hypothetical protein